MEGRIRVGRKKKQKEKVRERKGESARKWRGDPKKLAEGAPRFHCSMRAGALQLCRCHFLAWSLSQRNPPGSPECAGKSEALWYGLRWNSTEKDTRHATETAKTELLRYVPACLVITAHLKCIPLPHPLCLSPPGKLVTPARHRFAYQFMTWTVHPVLYFIQLPGCQNRPSHRACPFDPFDIC